MLLWLGSLCFGMGDWILGYVDPTPIGENVFYFICAGHSAGYDAWKIVVTLVLAMVGMCFLIPGMTCIAEVARKSGTRRLLRYLFMLCAVGWMVIHFAVAVNVLVFSLAERAGGRELAVTLSHGLDSVCLLFLYCVYVFVAAALITLIILILCGKTRLKRTAALFTPAIPMGIIAVVSGILPASPFAYGLSTFCMNATALLYAPESFDAVVISNALHIMPHPEKALSEIRRVLKPDGVLFAPTFVHGESTGFRLRVKLMELVGFHTYHKWNAEEFSAFISEHGFEVIHQETLGGSLAPLCCLAARIRKI